MTLCKLLISSVLFCFILPLHAQLSLEQQQAIDAVFSNWNRTDSPGCALAIVQDGQIIYKKGYGMADLEHHIAIQPNTVFYAGSVSKQFVAMSILLLAEAGKLSLDDAVHQYVPELPDYNKVITIRHLLHHTSGLRDYLALIELSGRSYLDYVNKQAALDLIFRQKGLNFNPGEQYAYSNSGYLLLATIVERLSGMSFRQFTQEHIFKPLGMNHSFFNDYLYELVNNRAFSYQRKAQGGFEPLFMRFALVGSGGLYTTVEDLFKWDQNYYHNRLGKQQQSLIDTMLTDGKLNNGASAGYAFALVNGQYRGLATVGHTGSLAGYRAYYVRFPAQRFSIIILGNAAEFTPTTFAYKIADILLESHFTEAASALISSALETKQHAFTEQDLQEFPGRYYSEELDVFYNIIRKNDELYVQSGWQTPVSLRTLVQNEGFGLTPVRNRKGKITELLLQSRLIYAIKLVKM
ncbi:MAG: serine hydrolase domain-containing protein [Saprospiraceae bacterium]